MLIKLMYPFKACIGCPTNCTPIGVACRLAVYLITFYGLALLQDDTECEPTDETPLSASTPRGEEGMDISQYSSVLLL